MLVRPPICPTLWSAIVPPRELVMVLNEPGCRGSAAGHAVPQRLVVVRLPTRTDGAGVGSRWRLLGLGRCRITTGGIDPGMQLSETVFHRLDHLYTMGMRPLVVDQDLQGVRTQRAEAMGQAALGQVVVVGDGQLRSGRHLHRIPAAPRRKPPSPCCPCGDTAMWCGISLHGRQTAGTPEQCLCDSSTSYRRGLA